MAKDLLMGIDIGTQSTRAALIDLEGKVVTSASTAQELQTPRPGWAEQDPQDWWGSTIDNIKDTLQSTDAAAERIIGIGVSGQMHGTIPIDAQGELLSRGVQLWCDKRSADMVEEYKTRPEAEDAYRIAGSPPVANWLGFKIRWIKDFKPEVYGKTWKFILPKDYINYKLTGSIATDYSEASGSYLMDAHSKQWSQELAGQVGIELEKLPEIRPAYDVVGHVSREASSLTGLVAGTPVVVGAGDMLCMLLAAGITHPGRASDVTGTSSILSIFTEEPVLDNRLMNLHHVLPGWIPFGIIDSGGLALKWFKESLCQTEELEAERLGIDVYDLLNDLAGEIEPGAEGLMFFPYLMGERTLGTPYARGVFFGLTPRVGKGTMVRAIMEGITLELRRTVEIVESAGHEVDIIYHSGGGAHSDLWSQIKADIYKKKVATFETSEGGILGSAILAGVGAGLYSDPASGIEHCLRVEKEFSPRLEWSERYDEMFKIFKDIHDQLQVPFNRLVNIP